MSVAVDISQVKLCGDRPELVRIVAKKLIQVARNDELVANNPPGTKLG
jgi:hypothetical protein